MVYHPFPSTHWSLVGRADAALDQEARRAALTVLLRRYLPALRSYLMQVRRMPLHTVEDLLQSFVADKILEDRLLQHASAARGKFRTFLLTSLQNFIIDEHRARRADKRGGGRRDDPPATVESIESDTPAFSAEPDAPTAFDIAWARELLRNVLAAMREECERTNRSEVWEIFHGRIVREILDNDPPEEYDALARRLDLASPTHAANLLTNGKRLYGRLLRQAIAEYEKSESGIDQELLDLRAILAKSKPGSGGGEEELTTGDDGGAYE